MLRLEHDDLGRSWTGPSTQQLSKTLITSCRTRPKHDRHKNARFCPTITISSHTVTSDIGMMGIYCPSRLLSHFSTAIDGVDTLINALGPASGAIYTPLMQRSQVHSIL
ncbi:hypothetical protein A2U01_0029984 [Trifolium medium]|uniref:Uncharacterized protein n=1 Tax=Trifolium medium TaxID=97028 RepID=A0A392PAX7_9FABA|nr:hypothetical protein [Trifolium medium]